MFMDKKKVLQNIMWWSLGTFVVSIGLAAVLFMQLGPDVKFDNWIAMFALTALDLNNLGMTGIILAGFILLYRKARMGKLLASFAPYGRTALTNYVLQSVLGTFILYGWGLGLSWRITKCLHILNSTIDNNYSNAAEQMVAQ